ncbi:hypothetical protein KKC32_02995 [Patescibacteria group bacterium]|nr:hypothetical protein [Patescibacteria group bacterium]
MTEQINIETENFETMAVKANLSNVEREYFDKLKAELKQILGGKTFEEIEKTQDLVLARKASKKMSEILNFLKTKEVETKGLIIKDAKNPFAEAFRDGGVDAPETIDYVLNFEELADMNAKVYETRGLQKWAEEVKKAKEKLGKMSIEQLEIIKQEIKEGSIPIIMPGKKIMMETTLEQIKKLRPIFKKENEEINLAKESNYSKQLTEKLLEIGNELLLCDIPDEPYILFTDPTQKPRFLNCTVEEQKNAITYLNANRTEGNKIYAMNLPEYAAMQTMFAEMVKKRSNEENVVFSQLRPLDCGRAFWTSFISLPVSAKGLIPVANWENLYSELFFSLADAVNPYPGAGVRLAERMEI